MVPAIDLVHDTNKVLLKPLAKDWESIIKQRILTIASYLNEPVCKVRDYYYTFYILDETYKTATQKVKKFAFLIFGIAIFSFLTPFTAPFAAALRGIVAAFQSKPYLYLKRPSEGSVLPDDKKITLFSHNQCYMPAGYSITDGQVTSPSKERMDLNIEKILSYNPDIICLFEVEDICDANYLSSKLDGYPFIIPVSGMRAIGPSSMIYVASKYEIVEESIQFVPFIKDVELTGRAKFSEKGFLSFDIKSHGKNKSFATIVCTHLQHSEIPKNPIEDEKRSRNAQMIKIINHIKGKKNPVIFTGDFNLSEIELNEFISKNSDGNLLRRDENIKDEPTWSGDKWCADLMDKEASKAQVLDYTFVVGETEIKTNIEKDDSYKYDSAKFGPNATSDHRFLYSEITLQ